MGSRPIAPLGPARAASEGRRFLATPARRPWRGRTLLLGAPIAALLGALVVCQARSLDAAESSPACRVATFRCELTPPVGGQPLIWLDRPETIEDALWAKGIVLEYDGRRCALVAIDWCGLCNSSHDLFRDRLAAAIDTTADRVAVHTVHQHTAPYVDGDAQRLMDAFHGLPLYVDEAFVRDCADRVAAAAKESLGKFEPVDRVGTGEAAVECVASSRRVRDARGRVVVRYSNGGRDPKMRDLPEGTIDPLLRTVTLARGQQNLVRLHFYATHPQSFYGDRRVSADVPGLARRRLEEEEDVFQVYFTGCAGDVTFGKYNDGSREARAQLADRLYRGMKAAAANTRWAPADRFAWCAREVTFPARNDPGHTAEELRAVLADEAATPLSRVLAAVRLSYFDRQQRPFRVHGLRIGPAVVVHLPGESLLEFQRYAISLAGDRFVAVAAYGDLGSGYICPKAAFEEGGYEPSASHVAPDSEDRLKEAIRAVLDDLQ